MHIVRHGCVRRRCRNIAAGNRRSCIDLGWRSGRRKLNARATHSLRRRAKTLHQGCENRLAVFELHTWQDQCRRHVTDASCLAARPCCRPGRGCHRSRNAGRNAGSGGGRGLRGGCAYPSVLRVRSASQGMKTGVFVGLHRVVDRCPHALSFLYGIQSTHNVTLHCSKQRLPLVDFQLG